MSTPPERLQTIFAVPGWSRFIDLLVQYRDRGQPLPSVVTVTSPTENERRLHARLLRLPIPSSAGALRYDLKKISAALQAADLSADWMEILTVLRGPITTETLVARQLRENWRNFWPKAVSVLDKYPFAASREWLDSLQRDGLLRRLCRGDIFIAERWIEQGACLLNALPLAEDLPLASVAARFCGASHALDPDTALSTLVLRGLALQRGSAMPTRSDQRRELWNDFRVICDEVSAPVLTFNLQLQGVDVISRLVESASSGSQPIHLTSRLLWATDWSHVACPPKVFICENPTIVSLAANQLGPQCPPFISTDGEPKTAARLLLRRLRAGGSALYYHGDFDWAGVAIAQRIFHEFHAEPWCFDAVSYKEAAAHEGRSLTGKPIPTPWSPALADTMLGTGIAYDEELLADDLLGGLGQFRELLKVYERRQQ